MPTKFVSKNIRVPVLNLTSLGHVKVLTMLDLENIRHANAIFSVKVSMKTSGILNFQHNFPIKFGKRFPLAQKFLNCSQYILTNSHDEANCNRVDNYI